MRTTADAIKSVQLYLAQEVFPAPWDVRRVLENQRVERPYVLITQNGPDVTSPDVFAPTVTIAITVHAYPVKADTREAADDAALDLRALLWRAFKVGLGDFAKPNRVPLWDFDPATVPEGQEAPYRNYCDYMRIPGDVSTHTIRDPADPTLVTVVCDF
jgi:hypothetical protein